MKPKKRFVRREYFIQCRLYDLSVIKLRCVEEDDNELGITKFYASDAGNSNFGTSKTTVWEFQEVELKTALSAWLAEHGEKLMSIG